MQHWMNSPAAPREQLSLSMWRSIKKERKKETILLENEKMQK